MIANAIRVSLYFYLTITPVLLSIDTKINLLENLKKTSRTEILYLLFLSALILAIWSLLTNLKIKKLEKMEEAIKLYRTIFGYKLEEELRKISKSLSFTENERISIFIYSASLDKFFIIARYSKSPNYNKTGRYVINNQKEYVYTVINEDETIHYTKSPKQINKWYKLFNKRNMDSRDMYGVPIVDNKEFKIGVIIYQSMSKNKFYNEDIRRKIITYSDTIKELLHSLNINPNYIKDTNMPIKGF